MGIYIYIYIVLLFPFAEGEEEEFSVQLSELEGSIYSQVGPWVHIVDRSVNGTSSGRAYLTFVFKNIENVKVVVCNTRCKSSTFCGFGIGAQRFLTPD